jgi:hypothetical protein
MHVLREIMLGLIVTLPLWHVLGVLPAVRTLVHVIAEQFDMHVFGGAGTFDPRAAVFSAVRATVAAAVGLLLFWLAARFDARWLGLESTTIALPGSGVFSLACGLVTASAWAHARTPSNPDFWVGTALANTVSAMRDPLPAKVAHMLRVRTHYTLLVALAVGLLVVVAHVVGFFGSTLHPHVLNVLIAMAAIMGFMRHIVLSAMRSPHPGRCLSIPLLGTAPGEDASPRRPFRWFESVKNFLSFFFLFLWYFFRW